MHVTKLSKSDVATSDFEGKIVSEPMVVMWQEHVQHWSFLPEPPSGTLYPLAQVILLSCISPTLPTSSHFFRILQIG